MKAGANDGMDRRLVGTQGLADAFLARFSGRLDIRLDSAATRAMVAFSLECGLSAGEAERVLAALVLRREVSPDALTIWSEGGAAELRDERVALANRLPTTHPPVRLPWIAFCRRDRAAPPVAARSMSRA